MIRLALIAFIACAALPLRLAHAECDIIGAGLKEKIKEYTAFRDKNVQQYNALISTETGCEKQGATISTRVATLATAASCDAQMEVAAMDKEMTVIGEKCETHFKKINELQVMIHTKFSEVQDDLEEGMDYMKKSKILNEYCGPEIKATKKMVQSFLELELNIVSVQARSVDGKTNYGKFKDTAKSLQALSTGRHLACGEMASTIATALAVKPVKGKPGAGSATPNFGGRAANPVSDVTGAPRAARLAAEGNAIVQGQKGGGLKVSAPGKGSVADGKESLASKSAPSDVSGKTGAGSAALASLYEGIEKQEPGQGAAPGTPNAQAAPGTPNARDAPGSPLAASTPEPRKDGSLVAEMIHASKKERDSPTAAGPAAAPATAAATVPSATTTAGSGASAGPSPAVAALANENDPFSDMVLPGATSAVHIDQARAPASAEGSPGVAPSGVVALGEINSATINKDTSLASPDEDLFGRVKRRYQRTELYRSSQAKKL